MPFVYYDFPAILDSRPFSGPLLSAPLTLFSKVRLSRGGGGGSCRLRAWKFCSLLAHGANVFAMAAYYESVRLIILGQASLGLPFKWGALLSEMTLGQTRHLSTPRESGENAGERRPRPRRAAAAAGAGPRGAHGLRGDPPQQR